MFTLAHLPTQRLGGAAKLGPRVGLPLFPWLAAACPFSVVYWVSPWNFDGSERNFAALPHKRFLEWESADVFEVIGKASTVEYVQMEGIA